MAAGLSFVGALGWVEVASRLGICDVTLNGVTTRVIGTHLERVDSDVQKAQALELLDGLAATTTPVVLLGDFNAAGSGGVPGESDTSTYRMTPDNHFVDAWAARHSGPGFSCCQAKTV